MVKFLKALLALLTVLAAVFTCTLLFWQEKTAPRYVQIYDNKTDL